MEKRNIYKGHRYVPKLEKEPWDSTKEYEGLTVVQHEGNSFTSRQFVPAGVDIKNTEFWASTGNYNAQIENYRQDVRNLETKVETDITAIETKVTNDLNAFGEQMVDIEESLATKPTIQNADMIFNIPSDFTTLPEAFEHIGNYTEKLNKKIVINIEAGHRLTSGLHIDGGDYSRVIITSDDPVVYTTQEVKTFDTNKGNITITNQLFIFDSCIAPVFDLLIDLEGKPIYGLLYNHEAVGTIERYRGIINGEGGVQARSARLWARSTKFTGHQQYGVRFTSSGMGDVAGVDVSNCCQAYFDGSLEGALDVSRGSMVYANDLICIGSGSNGIDSRRSWVVAENAVIKNSHMRGINSRNGSHVITLNADVTGNALDLACREGGHINIQTGSTYDTADTPVNVITEKGFIIDDDVNYKVIKGSSIIQEVVNVNEGYWVRQDGWARAWKQVSINGTNTNPILVDCPLNFTSIGQAGVSLASGGGTSNARLQDFKKLAVSFSIDNDQWTCLMTEAGTTETNYVVYVEGYVNL